MKYELLKEDSVTEIAHVSVAIPKLGEHTLYRVRALVDIKIHPDLGPSVKAGELGGYVSEGALSQEGACWVYEGSRVSVNPDFPLRQSITDDSVVRGVSKVIDSRVSGRSRVWDCSVESSTIQDSEVSKATLQQSTVSDARVWGSHVKHSAIRGVEGTANSMFANQVDQPRRFLDKKTHIVGSSVIQSRLIGGLNCASQSHLYMARLDSKACADDSAIFHSSLSSGAAAKKSILIKSNVSDGATESFLFKVDVDDIWGACIIHKNGYNRVSNISPRGEALYLYTGERRDSNRPHSEMSSELGVCVKVGVGGPAFDINSYLHMCRKEIEYSWLLQTGVVGGRKYTEIVDEYENVLKALSPRVEQGYSEQLVEEAYTLRRGMIASILGYSPEPQVKPETLSAIADLEKRLEEWGVDVDAAGTRAN